MDSRDVDYYECCNDYALYHHAHEQYYQNCLQYSCYYCYYVLLLLLLPLVAPSFISTYKCRYHDYWPTAILDAVLVGVLVICVDGCCDVIIIITISIIIIVILLLPEPYSYSIM